MCLHIDTYSTKKAKKKTGRIIYYKVLRLDFGLSAPFFNTAYVKGINESNRKLAVAKGLNISESYEMFNYGIHVCLTYSKAKKVRLQARESHLGGNFIIVPVICDFADLVAIGIFGDALFDKIYISDYAYFKATRQKTTWLEYINHLRKKVV